MITMKFIVFSIFYGNESEKRRCTKYNLVKEYDENKNIKRCIKRDIL